jgi:GAF domain-containing protein/two-component sensor histidine kinase/HAMP domain-containing protein
MFPTRSLRAKTLLYVLVPTVLGLLAVAIIALYAYERVAQDLVQGRDTELARLQAARLSEGLAEYTALLEDFATERDVRSMDMDRLAVATTKAPDQFKNFDAGVVIFDEEGVAVWATHAISGRRGTTYPLPSQFDQLRRTSQPSLSDVFADPVTGGDLISLAVPVLGPTGQFLGVVAGLQTVGSSTFAQVYTDLLQVSPEGSRQAYVVDGNGRVIYHSAASRTGSDLSAWAPVAQAIGGENGGLLTEDETGKRLVSGFAPVPNTQWALVTQQDWADIAGPIRGYSRLLLGVLVFAGVSSVALVFLTIGRALRPIHDLTRGAERIAGGDFDHTISAQTGDELETLGQQFNVMAGALRESYRDLERKVADRTRELAALNAVAEVVSGTLDLRELLDAALDKTLEVVEVEAGGIYLLQEGGASSQRQVLTIASHKGVSEEFVAAIDNLEVGEGFSGRVVQTGEPLVVPNLSEDPRLTRSVVTESGFRTVAIVPLASRHTTWGSLFVFTRTAREFTDHDVEFLTHIADQIAVAIENARLFAAEQRRAEQFRVISDVSRHMTSILDVDDLLVQIVRSIKENMGYHHVGISLIEGSDLVVKAGAGPAFEDPGFQPLQATVGGEGITGWVAGTGQPLLVRDVSQDERYYPLSPDTQTRSELCVPLQTKEATIGVLNVESDELDAFDQNDLAILQSMANQAAIAIQNARLFASEQRRAEQFRLLSEVGTRITSLLTVDELLDQTVRLVNEVLGYYLVNIGLVEGDELAVKAVAGPPRDRQDSLPPQVRLGEGISGWVARTGEPLLAPDVTREPRYVHLESSTETRSELAVPLRTKTETLGVLDVQSNQPNAFDEGDLVVLQSLADLTAIAMEEARLLDAEQRRAEQFRVISEVGASITSILTVDELLREIVRLVRTSLGYYHTAIGLVEDGDLVMQAGVGAHWEDPDFQPSRLPVGGQGITAWVASTGEALLVPDVSQDSRYLLLPGSEEIRSEVAVPLKTTAGVIGVLDVQSDQIEGLDESDLAVLKSVAHQAAIAIENARLYQQAQQAAALEERSRLARDLHDAVTQTLFSASLIGEVLPTVWEGDEAEGRQLLAELRQLTRGALAEMRTLLLELRPTALAESNLQDLLGQLGEAVTGRSGLPVNVQVVGDPELPADVHVALYRIAQEALNNVVKHSHASEVSVVLQCGPPPGDGEAGYSQTARLDVKDNGCGFDLDSVPADRLGLGIIRERAESIGATLKIKTKPGSGTTVQVVWTYKPPEGLEPSGD